MILDASGRRLRRTIGFHPSWEPESTNVHTTDLVSSTTIFTDEESDAEAKDDKTGKK